MDQTRLKLKKCWLLVKKRFWKNRKIFQILREKATNMVILSVLTSGEGKNHKRLGGVSHEPNSSWQEKGSRALAANRAVPDPKPGNGGPRHAGQGEHNERKIAAAETIFAESVQTPESTPKP